MPAAPSVHSKKGHRADYGHPERTRVRCKFDPNDDRPILGDLIKEARGGSPRRFVAREIGIGAHVVADLELHYGAFQEEIDKALKWLSKKPDEVQLPRPIVHRAYGRPLKGAPADSVIAEAILAWVQKGELVSTFESPEYSVSRGRAKTLVSRWLQQDNDFRVKFEQALAVGAYFLAAKAIEATLNPANNPVVATNQMKAYQWAAEKFNRQRFGKTETKDVTVNIGFGDALEALERRRRERELPAPKDLAVIDIEPEPLPVKEHKIINGVVQLD